MIGKRDSKQEAVQQEATGRADPATDQVAQPAAAQRASSGQEAATGTAAIGAGPDDVIDLADVEPRSVETSAGPAVERAADLYRAMIETETQGNPLESLDRWVSAVQDRLRDIPALVQQESASLDARVREATSSLERRLAELEVGLKEAGGRTDERAAGVDQRISRLEQRRSDLALSLEDTVDERVQRMDSRLVDEARRIDGRMAELQQRIGAVNESLEARLRAIETRIQQVFGLFGQVAQAVDRETSAPGSSESPRDMPASTPSGEERMTDTPRSSTSNMFEA
jgi:predicted  nucleic acid-binding Zn-ribbon protein